MGYLIGAVLALFAFFAALWLVLLIAMWVVVPMFVIVLPVAVLVGAGTAVVAVVLVLLAKPGWAAREVTPDDVLAGGALRQRKAGKRDHAWPVYPAAQWREDQAAMRSAVFVRVIPLVWRRFDGFRKSYSDRVGVVLGVLGYPVLLAWAGGLAVMWAVLAAITAAVVFVGWLGWLAVAGFLRGADTLVRKARRAQGSCPSCYHITDLPLFPCDGCGRAQADIRPGRLGGVSRRCACGTSLPTTVLRAAGRLTPTCPRCEAELRPGAAVLTDIRLPVFGPISAGKTRLVYAGMLALRDRVVAAGASFDFVDEDSKTAFDDGTAVITSGATTRKTDDKLLPAVTARLTVGKRRALVHLFDASGESYANRDGNTALEFLDHAQGLVFVVDPFSIGSVADQLGGAQSASVRRASPATADAEQTYHLTVRRLQDFQVDTTKRRLAVAVVKSDLLAGLPFAERLLGGDVERWLVDIGLDNLVLSAKRDFAEVRFFVVASIAERGARGTASPAEPFGWLLARAGFPVLPAIGDRSEEVV
ncbi:hypothetical protein [Actinokineospora sp. NBRC 105648]|uniref:TRAFAC clade GTPase domain-containing protein n=1 Tax=Actinokineospora sp. NBRC 105648 TaxID=3032206 RepID=UPI0024A4AD31|nr:hypothetical protein [Actinokineospora sp. NBRC 105648]GLZ42328.1 hypothetical protein Acsp05_59520 [Actinokineospora sp. NBRC 105648]